MSNHHLWTARHEECAQYVADGAYTMPQVASMAGVALCRLTTWSRSAEFKARVHAIVQQRRKQIEDQILSEGTARLAQRVRDRQDLRDRLFQIIHERAADPNMVGVPGGTSGLIIAMHHKNGEITHVTDTALVSKVESLLRDTAKDKGEWVQKVEQVGALDMLRSALAPVTGEIDMSDPEISDDEAREGGDTPDD